MRHVLELRQRNNSLGHRKADDKRFPPVDLLAVPFWWLGSPVLQQEVQCGREVEPSVTGEPVSEWSPTTGRDGTAEEIRRVALREGVNQTWTSI